MPVVDLFPGLQQDCLDLIEKCNAMIGLALKCRSEAAEGNFTAIGTTCQEINTAGEELGEMCAAFEHTTDHLGPDEE